MIRFYSIRYLTWVRPTSNLHTYYQMYQINQRYRQAAHLVLPAFPGRSRPPPRPNLLRWQGGKSATFGFTAFLRAGVRWEMSLPPICCSKLDSCSSSSGTVIDRQSWQLWLSESARESVCDAEVADVKLVELSPRRCTRLLANTRML